MDRTPEQKAADSALTAAINACRQAYAEEGQPAYLMTDYLVLFAAQRFDAEGDSWSMVGHIYRDSDIPAYRILGLLDFAHTRMQALVASDELED